MDNQEPKEPTFAIELELLQQKLDKIQDHYKAYTDLTNDDDYRANHAARDFFEIATTLKFLSYHAIKAAVHFYQIERNRVPVAMVKSSIGWLVNLIAVSSQGNPPTKLTQE